MLEERDGSGNTTHQYVWSPVYVDAMVLRDRDLADGTLDASFDGDGIVTTDFGGSESGYAVAAQADGKLVVAGVAGGDFALARYNTDGSLDSSFGTGGKVTTDFGATDTARGIAIQSDGKIVVAGYSGNDFALARYNADGSLDTTFGTGGKVTTDFGGTEYGYALLLQPDGRLVVAGASGNDFALARYNSDGSLDTTFGTGGKVVTDLGGWEFINAIAIQSDGKLVVSGNSEGSSLDIGVARYNTDGSLDTTFGTGGKVILDFGNVETNYDLVLQADGKILLAGDGYPTSSSPAEFLLVRLASDGSLDTTFGTNGVVWTGIESESIALSLALDGAGRIVLAGTALDSTTFSDDFAVARYLADGSLDTSFGNGGIFTLHINGSDSARDVLIQADGAIVLAGVAGGDFGVARLHAGSLEERLYALHDANFNVTALVGDSGTGWGVIERYVYDPYGERTVLDASWAADADGQSDVGWVYGHQGGRHDLAAGLVHFRFRDLDTSLGRWTRQDPLGYVDGANTYAAFASSLALDPSGLTNRIPRPQWWTDWYRNSGWKNPGKDPDKRCPPGDCACLRDSFIQNSKCAIARGIDGIFYEHQDQNHVDMFNGCADKAGRAAGRIAKECGGTPPPPIGLPDDVPNPLRPQPQPQPRCGPPYRGPGSPNMDPHNRPDIPFRPYPSKPYAGPGSPNWDPFDGEGVWPPPLLFPPIATPRPGVPGGQAQPI